MPIKSGFYKGRLGIGLDTTDNAYTSGSDTGIPLYPLDINGDIRISGCIVNKQGAAINLSSQIFSLMTTDNSTSKIDVSTNFNILSTGHLKLPSGTTAQRTATGVLGMLRYNTTTNSFEGYGAGNAWGSLGGVMDIDQDTYITAEQSSDEDKLRFYVGGNEKMLIQNTTNDGIIIKSHIIPDTNAAYDLGNAEKKIRHLFLSDNSLWIGDEHRISIDNDGSMKFKKRNKNVVPKSLRTALNLDSAASITKVKADMGVADISTMKLEDWVNYARTHATGMANADIKDIFNNEDNEDYEQVDGTVTTVGELNSITNVNTDTKAQGQPLVWNGGTWSASTDINIYNGKVGIGTTSPYYKLEVNGSSWLGADTKLLSTALLSWANAGNNAASTEHYFSAIKGDATNKYLSYFTNNNERMRINSSGNVGIGTTSPEYSLDLSDSAAVGTNGTSAKFIRFGAHNTDHNSSGGLIWKTNYGGSYTKISAKIEAICENDYFRQGLAFFTGNEASYTTDVTERMRIDRHGNVGIGTTSPSQKLDIQGTGASATGIIRFTDVDTADNARNWFVGPYRSSDACFAITPSASKGGASPDTTKTLQISYNGNVGIGTTTPTAKLQVDGDFHIKPSGQWTSTTGKGLYLKFLGGYNGSTFDTGYIQCIDRTTAYPHTMYPLLFHASEYSFQSGEGNNDVKRMIIDTNGNVGIGTESPNCALEVHGGAGSNDEVLILSNKKDSAASEYHSIFTLGGHHYDVYSNSTIQNGKSTSNGSHFHINYYSGGNVTLCGLGNGNVGIGETAPSEKLEVNGTVKATKFIGDGSELTGVATSGGGGFNWTAQDGTKNISDTNMHHGYKVSASNNNSDNQYNANNAFRNMMPNPNWGDMWETTTLPYNTTTGAYTGSETTAGVTGEWLQINFGREAKVYHYGILPLGEQGGESWSAPRTFVLFGSNDGSNWTNLGSSSATHAEYHGDSQNQNYDAGNYPTSSCKMKETTLSTPATYQYFRLVITANFGNHTQYSEFSAGGTDGRIRLSYLAFYGNFPNERIQTLPVSGVNMSFVNFTDTPSITLTANTLTELTDFQMSIKPQYSDSVIRLEYNIHGSIGGASWDGVYVVTRTVGDVETALTKDPTNNQYYSGYLIAGDNVDTMHSKAVFQYCDEPNTTELVIYKIKFRDSGSTTRTLHINKTDSTTPAGTSKENAVSSASAIEHPKPQAIMSSVNNSTAVEGQILETLSGICDGRSVKVNSGIYTLENVTTDLQASTTFIDITGSTLNYKPPSGTVQVIYEFEFQHQYHGTNGWGYYKFLLDGTQVGEVFELGFDDYGSSWQKVSFIFEIGEDDLSNGKILTWDSHKEIKMQFREHNSSTSQVRVHIAANWVESNTSLGGTGLIKPRIKVQAIGTAQYDVVQRVVTYKDGQVLETLAGICDGRSITVASGAYMLENVTEKQVPSTANTVITGSTINYKPPAGTKQLIYIFEFAFSYFDGRPIIDVNFFIDNSEVTIARNTITHGDDEFTYKYKVILSIGETDDIANGKISSWNSLKTLHTTARNYSGSYEGELHYIDNGVPSGGAYVQRPKIEIQAIGRAASNNKAVITESGGNVGIGTTSPANKLHIKGGNLIIERPNTEAPRIELIRNGSTNTFGGDNWQDWAIQNSGGDFELISGHSTNGNTTVLSSDGTNVGIGTTSFVDTRAILHLLPAGNSGIAFQANTSEANSRNWRIRQDDYGPWGNLQFTCGDSNTDFGDSESDVVMSMTHQRRVGIGTTSPTEKLEVDGTVKATAFEGDGSGLTGITGASSMGGTMTAHIIPDTNAAYDLGNAEYKIRHLFLSDNSLWVGDGNKISAENGKMKFKKRKANKIPDGYTGNETPEEILTEIFGENHNKELKDISLQKWVEYSKNKGLNIGVSELFNESNDFEKDNENVEVYEPQLGDMTYYDGNEWKRIPIGTEGQTLKIVNGLPNWV